MLYQHIQRVQHLITQARLLNCSHACCDHQGPEYGRGNQANRSNYSLVRPFLLTNQRQYTTRRALRLVRGAVEIQRFYTEMKQKGFAFNKGLRVALNYGYYRLLPMRGAGSERITEFYGPGIVELSRLTTGKANKEIEEFASFLIAHGYEQQKVQQFFAQLSVFRGGWTLEAAESICEQPRALEYLERLRESGEADGMRRRLAGSSSGRSGRSRGQSRSPPTEPRPTLACWRTCCRRPGTGPADRPRLGFEEFSGVAASRPLRHHPDRTAECARPFRRIASARA